MRTSLRLLAAAAFGFAAFVQGAAAQETVTTTSGGTTISVGGGGQFLTLPDIRFTGKGNPGSFHRQDNADFSDYGGSIGGVIETPLGFWGGYRVTGSVKGFFSEINTDDRVGCQGGCVLVDPTGSFLASGSTLRTKTSRDVDYWGGMAEAKFWQRDTVQVRPNLYRNDYFIIGADIRGIDQDNNLHGRAFNGLDVFKLNESIDTTYYGGYIGFGGEYSLGFLGTGGLMDRLGIRTFISGRAGLYEANTDYDGKFAYLVSPFASKLSKSSDDLAFIGTLSFEARKDLGPHTSIGLYTDYEYISSVPKIKYADLGGTTRIEDEGAFASRTMLRFNYTWGGTPGPAPVYGEPLK
ncbi:hypothetical protein [Methyloceanibacter sp.]|uniref:hypothetical protein n=1 Tax=Methyloceanibacter sp. TaxID=1965321 RepID=UPI002D6B8C27|nr:hypothetical protein [Methyloceanibacter sp.]HZP10151.1 hypothetical protein [Methyloceanibacter sp.]